MRSEHVQIVTPGDAGSASPPGARRGERSRRHALRNRVIDGLAAHISGGVGRVGDAHAHLWRFSRNTIFDPFFISRNVTPRSASRIRTWMRPARELDPVHLASIAQCDRHRLCLRSAPCRASQVGVCWLRADSGRRCSTFIYHWVSMPRIPLPLVLHHHIRSRSCLEGRHRVVSRVFFLVFFNTYRSQ